MLKSFMQPGTSSRTDTTRTSQSPYASTKPAEPAKAAEPAKPEAAPASAPAAAPVEEGSKLIVGPNIKLKGSEITDCEILVVEGRVEASMKSRVIRIAEGGVFSGKAEIDVAEVRGAFEGELTGRSPGYTAGVRFESRSGTGVQQLDNLDDAHVVALQRLMSGRLDLVPMTVRRF